MTLEGEAWQHGGMARLEPRSIPATAGNKSSTYWGRLRIFRKVEVFGEKENGEVTDTVLGIASRAWGGVGMKRDLFYQLLARDCGFLKPREIISAVRIAWKHGLLEYNPETDRVVRCECREVGLEPTPFR